jgi:hypothetical protein
MSDYRINQLKILLLLRHLNELNDVCEDEVVNPRLRELEEQHNRFQDNVDLKDKYSKLFNRMQNSDDKKQRKEMLLEFDSLVGCRLFEAEKFYYWSGIYDAMEIFNIS